MLWKHNPTLEMLNASGHQTLVQHLGIEFTEIGEDYLIATMPVDQRTKQPMGLLHGGASVSLAETLGSVASVCLVDNPLETPIVGVEINANHLSSAKEGYVIGKVTPIKIGRRMHVWNIAIADEAGKNICISRLTTMVLSKS